MQKKCIHKNFFLQNSLTEELYHTMAKSLPVVDYHNHLNPKDIAKNRRFLNISEAWVMHDPYKHRAMRICGVSENGITGNATDREKFTNWAKTVPKTLGNPLFLWSALELKRIFGIEEFLSEKNAMNVWDNCNHQLQQEGFGTVDILKKFNAETVCTSDDLLDDLSYHQQATKEQGIQVFPSLRGDSILAFELPGFKSWFTKFENQSTQNIHNLDDYKSAIIAQIEKFSVAGCLLADHSLDSGFIFNIPIEKVIAETFKKWLNGNELTVSEIFQLKNHLLIFLGEEYAKLGWVLQLHIGAQRFTSSRLRKLAGPAGGFATIGKSCDIAGFCSFFDELEKKEYLPKIILYTLNPADNEPFATLTGSYAEDGVPGKIQFGPGWWYNDQYEGIRKQLIDLSSYGLLSQFIGMTTDSRSVFSFSRHEYFRRILCNQIGQWVKEGLMPDDMDLIGGLVKDISYFNIKNWLFK